MTWPTITSADNTFRDLVKVIIPYLEAATKELEVRTALMGMEYREIVDKQEEQEKQEQGVGMMRAPFGYCPECGAIGVSRDRDGTDICKSGHVYHSDTAVLRFDKKPEKEK